MANELPHSQYAEESLLGAILLDPRVLEEIVDIVQPREFHDWRYGRIYSAALTIRDKNEPVDPVTIAQTLISRGEMERVGGAATLMMLGDTVPSAAHAKQYATVVHDKYMLRQAIDTARSIMASAYEQPEDVDAFLGRSEKLLFDLTESRFGSGFLPIIDHALAVLHRIDKIKDRSGAICGVPSGLIDLDNMLGTFQAQDLIILAARPGIGKTALALNMAVSAAKSDCPVDSSLLRCLPRRSQPESCRVNRESVDTN